MDHITRREVIVSACALGTTLLSGCAQQGSKTGSKPSARPAADDAVQRGAQPGSKIDSEPSARPAADDAAQRGAQPGSKTDNNPSMDVAQMLRLLEDSNPKVRAQAALALGDISRSINAGLRKALIDSDPEVRAAVAEILNTKGSGTQIASPEVKREAKPCIKCNGKGTTRDACKRCNGSKEESCALCGGNRRDVFDRTKACTKCAGTGKGPCFGCKGSGEVTATCSRCSGSGQEK